MRLYSRVSETARGPRLSLLFARDPSHRLIAAVPLSEDGPTENELRSETPKSSKKSFPATRGREAGEWTRERLGSKFGTVSGSVGRPSRLQDTRKLPPRSGGVKGKDAEKTKSIDSCSPLLGLRQVRDVRLAGDEADGDDGQGALALAAEHSELRKLLEGELETPTEEEDSALLFPLSGRR